MLYKNKWALITGASAGIGKEFAIQLAAHGANLVLVARRLDRLEDLATTLRQTGIEVKCITLDLAKANAITDLTQTLNAQEVKIDILINNAGFGLTGTYLTRSWEEHNDFIQLMVTAYAALVHAVLPHMEAQQYGRIVNVASVAGLVPPSSGHTLYGPSKAFLVSFSQALAAEGQKNNVKVTALCPGFTFTEFHDVTDTRAQIDALPKFMLMNVTPTVEGTIKAVENGKVVFVPGVPYKFLVWLSMRLPRPFVERLVRGSSSKYRNQEKAPTAP